MKNRFLEIVLLGASCFTLISVKAQNMKELVINEIQVANIDQFVDPSFNYGGWIELYNPSSTPLELYGCWVSDDIGNLKKVHITQSMIVPAHGFHNLWFGHHDKYCPSQIDMELDVDGGIIYLSDADGNLIQSQEYPPAICRTSWTRKTDGNEEWGYTDSPTPVASNGKQSLCELRLESPKVEIESSCFKDKFAFFVPIPKGATLRYTTDGTTPTMTKGLTSKTGVFIVSDNTIMRFALFQKGFLRGPVVTRTFIKEDKSFGLPIMSIVTDPANLYSKELGIFVKGINGRPGRGQKENYNWNMDWDRPINFELMTEKGYSVLNQEAEMYRCGGWSRSWTPFCYKVHAAKQYEGDNFFDYAVFPDKPFNRYKTLQIRNGGTVSSNGRVKDAFLQKLVLTSGLNIDAQDYQPVLQYINGVYHGVINVREPSNKQFVYANYGLDEEEIDMYEIDADSGYVQKCGTRDAFERWYELSQRAEEDDIYAEIENLVDIDEYANYMAVEFYLGNTDWPQNNVKAWRPNIENGKFRYVLFDLDFSFSTFNSFSAFEGRRMNTFNELFGENQSRIRQEIKAVTIFVNMLKNEKFRKYFIDAFCLVAGSVFETSRCEKLINDMLTRVYPMQILKEDAYGKNISPIEEANEVLSHLKCRAPEMYNVLEKYSRFQLSGEEAQSIIISSNLQEAQLRINNQPIPTGFFDGKLYQPITMMAEAPAGYHFDGWFNDADICLGKNPEIQLPKGEIKITARFNLNEDSCFSRCPIVINEVSASNSIYVNDYSKKRDWIELYNCTSKEIDLAGMYLSDDASQPQKYEISDEGTGVSTMIPAHGFKIIWCDKNTPISQLHASFKLSNEENSIIMLSSSDMSWTDTFEYNVHDGMQTIGRYPDGTDKVYLMTRPTIGNSNRMNTYSHSKKSISSFASTLPLISHASGLSLTTREGFILIKSEESKQVVLSIYTNDGKLKEKRDIDIEDKHAKYPISHLMKGLYIIEVKDSQKNCCAIKIVRK
jgi:hypothetical protein